MKFQVLGPVNLNSAQNKTTKKTYIMTFGQTSEKAPKRGVFSPNSPWGTQTRFFSRVNVTCFITRTYVSTFWPSFRKIKWTDVMLLSQKCHFWPFLWLFWPLLSPWALTSIFFKNRRMSLYNLSKVTTSCKISDNFIGWSRLKTWTDGQTGLKTIALFR